MAYRRKLIDRRTREGRKLGHFVDCAKGVGIIGVLIVGALSRSGDPPPATREATAAIIPQVQAASTQSAYVPARPPPRFQGYSASPVAGGGAEQGGLPAATEALAGAGPSQVTDGRAAAPVPWRHVTAAGARWSLRHVASGSLLLVDLGADQTASVEVAPAFEALDLPSMDARVDHIRSTVAKFFPVRTARYSFARDGTLRLLD